MCRARGLSATISSRSTATTAPNQFAYSKQIWDLAPIGWLVDPQWAQNGTGQFTASDR